MLAIHPPCSKKEWWKRGQEPAVYCSWLVCLFVCLPVVSVSLILANLRLHCSPDEIVLLRQSLGPFSPSSKITLHTQLRRHGRGGSSSPIVDEALIKHKLH